MAVITRLFDQYDDAQSAMQKLVSAGVPNADISIVANNADNKFREKNGIVDRDGDGVDDRAEGGSTGAGVGATLGGAAGLLAGLGFMAIPGIGPVVAAGWLAATALGAAVGGVTGGIIGALTQSGVSEEDAHVYAEGVRRGGTLLTARVPDADRVRFEGILDGTGVDVRERADTYRSSGWKKFDESTSGMTAEEIRAQRESYMR